MNYEQALERYDKFVKQCPRFERRGKTMPYTSANGYMFSLLNKAGEIGIRFSKEVQKKYLEEFSKEKRRCEQPLQPLSKSTSFFLLQELLREK